MRFFGVKPTNVALILYILYLNSLGLILVNFTELLFGVLILLAIYLYFFFNDKPYKSYLCGICIGLALGVRPTAIALVIAIVLLYLWDWAKYKKSFAGLFFILFGIGTYIVV